MPLVEPPYDQPYGCARLRVWHLPNGQFAIVMDQAGRIADDYGRTLEWAQLHERVMGRAGPECVGLLRFAGTVELDE